MLGEKVATLVWYLERPALYRELGRRLLNFRMTSDAERARATEAKERGIEWCKSHLQAPAALFDALHLQGALEPLSSVHPTWWDAANAAVDACPVRMGGPAATDLLFHIARRLPGRSVLETGVANGWSSLAFLAAMAENGEGRLISVDMPYAKMNNEAYVGCAVPEALRGRWTLLRLPDRDAVPRAIREFGTLDIVHHDSDKSYEGRMFVYEQCWPVLRPGGLLMSDDVEDNLAFRDFATRVGREPFVFSKKPGNFSGTLLK